MKINFNLYAGNGGIVVIEQIIQKTDGLVVIGIVTNGKISKGDLATVQVEDKAPLCDNIFSIEDDGERINTASPKQKIGIMLKKISKEILLGYLEKAA